MPESNIVIFPIPAATLFFPGEHHRNREGYSCTAKLSAALVSRIPPRIIEDAVKQTTPFISAKVEYGYFGCPEINMWVDEDIDHKQIVEMLLDIFQLFDAQQIEVIFFGRGCQLEDGTWDIWVM